MMSDRKLDISAFTYSTTVLSVVVERGCRLRRAQKESLPIGDFAYLEINSSEVKDRVVSCSTPEPSTGICNNHIEMYTSAFPMLKGKRSTYEAAECWKHRLPVAKSLGFADGLLM